MLWVLQRIFFGELPEKWNNLTDLNLKEYATLVPLVIIVIFLGVYPSPVLNIMSSSVNQLVDFVSKSTALTITGW
jgi:NADH-quinone oxidoreductase subunit M